MNKDFCEIYFIRHGATDWNLQGLLQGHHDIPLNDIGISQAYTLKKSLAHIPFAIAFSSDLSRAKKTAEIIIQPRLIPLHVDPALREMYAGPFEGRKGSEFSLHMQQSLASVPSLSKDEYLSYKWHPEVETFVQMHSRTKDFFQKQIQSYLGKSILVVSHGGVLRAWLEHFDFLYAHKWMVDNCGFIRLKANSEEFILDSFQGAKRISL